MGLPRRATTPWLNESQATRAAGWPWIASTSRLDQNLADAHALPSKIASDLERLWNKLNFCGADFGHREARSFARAKERCTQEMNLFLAALGVGSVQVNEQPHPRLVDEAGAAVPGMLHQPRAATWAGWTQN